MSLNKTNQHNNDGEITVNFHKYLIFVTIDFKFHQYKSENINLLW